MKFWDSSALVALLVKEADTPKRLDLISKDPILAMWWSTPVECESTLQRRVREGLLDSSGAKTARARLSEVLAAAHEVSPSPQLPTLAIRLLRTHALRATDALQLAAALTLAGALRGHLSFVCTDARLSDAAEIEGLDVLR